MSEPQPAVYLSELGASSIEWSVRGLARSEDYWDVRVRLTQRVKDALDDRKIGIPYPRMNPRVIRLLDHVGNSRAFRTGRPGEK